MRSKSAGRRVATGSVWRVDASSHAEGIHAFAFCRVFPQSSPVRKERAMKPTVKFDRTLVTVLVDEVVHVMLELAAPPAATMTRAPLDVVVVLDRSGSMSGAPLESVTAATAQLLRLAGPDDRVGVVAFDDEVQLVLPLAPPRPGHSESTVRAIQEGGSTNLSGGWLKGLSSSRLLHVPGRCVASSCSPMVTRTPASPAPTSWCNSSRAGTARASPRRALASTPGMTNSCWPPWPTAGWEMTTGAPAPDQATRVFVDEFGGLAAVVAQNVSVEITPSAAVATTAVLNEFPITSLPTGVQVALGDAYGGERRKLVARFHLRPVTAAGPIDVATLTIRWAATTGDVALHTVTVPVVVSAGNGRQGNPGASHEVTEEVLRLEVAKSRRDARDAAHSGDFGTASRLLSGGADLFGVRDGNAKRGRGIASRRCSAPGRPLVGSRIEASVARVPEAPTRADVPTTRRRKNQPEHSQSSVTNDDAASGVQHHDLSP